MASFTRSEYYAHAELQRATRGASWGTPSRIQRPTVAPRFTRAHAFATLGAVFALVEILTLYVF